VAKLSIALLRIVTVGLSLFSGLAAGQNTEISVQPGKAIIIIFRVEHGPLFSAGNTAYPIAFDKQWISNLPPGQYFAFPAWPGMHRIAPALRMETSPSGDAQGASAVDLQVQAGETYYIKASPGTFKNAGTIALELKTKESAQADMSGSMPVPWMHDLLNGTLAEVSSLATRSAPVGAECSSVEWHPDIDFIKTPDFARSSILYGSVLLQENSLLLKLASASGDGQAGIEIAYADIAAVEVKNRMLNRVVLITRRNGRLDSFSVLSAGGGRVDRDQTKICGDQLAGKLGH
jgi:hypothetical protein